MEFFIKILQIFQKKTSFEIETARDLGDLIHVQRSSWRGTDDVFVFVAEVASHVP
jgi:hypothetical protein